MVSHGTLAPKFAPVLEADAPGMCWTMAKNVSLGKEILFNSADRNMVGFSKGSPVVGGVILDEAAETLWRVTMSCPFTRTWSSVTAQRPSSISSPV